MINLWCLGDYRCTHGMKQQLSCSEKEMLLKESLGHPKMLKVQLVLSSQVGENESNQFPEPERAFHKLEAKTGGGGGEHTSLSSLQLAYCCCGCPSQHSNKDVLWPLYARHCLSLEDFQCPACGELPVSSSCCCSCFFLHISPKHVLDRWWQDYL
ncbi:unnamed protein product [Nyctereutes procyonoides]|uniref:(raccoon dog) hypothetical protein n=1 Tax=Nyctereutes procyonoides TaxID=34880 RepID=A0A811YSD6_NYCPR|nr:unnamed protein product [Nyctereutes procyonoides]